MFNIHGFQIQKVKYPAAYFTNNCAVSRAHAYYGYKESVYAVALSDMFPASSPMLTIPVVRLLGTEENKRNEVLQVCAGNMFGSDVVFTAYETGIVTITSTHTQVSFNTFKQNLQGRSDDVNGAYITSMNYNEQHKTLFVGLSSGVCVCNVFKSKSSSIFDQTHRMTRLYGTSLNQLNTTGKRAWLSIASIYANSNWVSVSTDAGDILLYEYDDSIKSNNLDEVQQGSKQDANYYWHLRHVFVRPPIEMVPEEAQKQNGTRQGQPVPGLDPEGPIGLRWEAQNSANTLEFFSTGQFFPTAQDLSYTYTVKEDMVNTGMVVKHGLPCDVATLHCDATCPLRIGDGHKPLYIANNEATPIDQGVYVCSMSLHPKLDILVAYYTTGHMRVFSLSSHSVILEVALHTRCVTSTSSFVLGANNDLIIASTGEDGIVIITRIFTCDTSEEKLQNIDVEIVKVIRLCAISTGLAWLIPDNNTSVPSLLISCYDAPYIVALPLTFQKLE